MKTVLFGLDGATYQVLDDLVARGVMPTLGSIYQDGCRSILTSTPVPLTPQAWTTLATGRSPGCHGVYDFLRPEFTNDGVTWRWNDSRAIRCETIWEYASRHGKRVTLLNYIFTSPPPAINGHSIPGFVAGRHLRRGSHPADLFTRLQQVQGFDVNVLGHDRATEEASLQHMPADRWLDWIGHHIERDRVWFGVMEHLMRNEPSDLTAIVFDGVDKIQHLAYRYLDPKLRPQNPTAWEAGVMRRCDEYFSLVDDCLARTLVLAGKWGRVFICSDHGFTASREVVYINRWLESEGLLHWKEKQAEDTSGALFIDRLGNLWNYLDRARTKAYAIMPTCNGIYINAPPAEYEACRDDIIRRLAGLRGEDGGPVVTAVRKREDCFHGPYVNQSADLLLTLRDHGFFSVLNGPRPVVNRPGAVGMHHPKGVLLAVGPGVRTGFLPQESNLLDIAPLLLHSLGLEIPAELEGRFPEALYDRSYLDSDPPRIASATHPVAAPAAPTERDDGMSEEDEKVLIERLKSLGYVE